MTTTPSEEAYRLLSNHGFAEVKEHLLSGQKALFSLQRFSTGDVITQFSAAEIRTSPNYLTVQTGEAQHIILYPTFIQYINHSCAPNSFFNTTSMRLEALTTIEPGTELTFFYPSTEWDMQQPFSCTCGYVACLGEIRGAAHLSFSQASSYRLTDYILNKRNAE
ncbi:MAG: SET domain-containing protein-lysine N-methyltransferase [Chitinophagaceae bacterium]